MPDNSFGGSSGCCFAGNNNSYVQKRRGRVYIESLKVGDEVLVIFGDGKLGYSEVWCMAHEDADKETEFLELRTPNREIHISPRHFIAVKKDDVELDMVMANKIKIGDFLVVCDVNVDADSEGTITNEPVVSIETIQGKGIYNPFTKEGTLLVNGILASCYAEVKPSLAHNALAPFRAMYSVTPKVVMDAIMTPNEGGIPHVLDAAFNVLEPVVAEH
ncbi:hypothetical protein SNE40_008229 [Patella caerulea]|uniref:Hint domain-containing protein n=1 Tax=Patella caerulea TaxID=87958 RepID=A0AAN8PUV1_PATCE